MFKNSKILSLSILFLVSVKLCLAQSAFSTEQPFDFITDYQFLQSLYPRQEGSLKEKQTIKYIEERAQILKLPLKTSDFSQAKDGHSFSHIIEIEIKGKIKDTLLIVSPLNHSFSASLQDSGSYGLSLALALMGYYAQNIPSLTLKFVFLGAEYQEAEQNYLGSQTYLSQLDSTIPYAVLYLSIKGPTKKINLRSGGRGSISPLWFLRSMTEALSQHKVDYFFSANRQQVHRTGIISVQTAVETYLLAGLPSIELETSPGESLKTLNKTEAEKLKIALQSFIDSFKNGFREEWDRHYIFFPLPFLSLLIPETEYLVLLLLLFIFLLTLAIYRRKAIQKYFKTLKHNLWNIPILFIVAFFLLLASTFYLQLILSLKNIPALWQNYPLLFLILKFALFMFGAVIIFKIFYLLPFAKNSSFYTAAAIFFILFCILIIALINISFIYYFIWSLICFVIFSFFKNKWLKIFTFLISPLSILTVIIELFFIPELKICEIILLNPILGNLLFTIILLPFVLPLIRIRFLFPFLKKYFWTSPSFLIGTIFLFVLIGTTIFIFLTDPYHEQNPKPILVENIINTQQNYYNLSIKAPAPLGHFEIIDNKGIRPVQTSARNYLVPLEEKPDLLSYQLKTTTFANRQNIDLMLNFAKNPLKLKLYLESEKPFILSDVNFPFKAKNINQFEIFVGPGAPQNLLLQFTVAAKQKYKLTIKAIFQDKLPSITISTNEKSKINYLIDYTKAINLEL